MLEDYSKFQKKLRAKVVRNLPPSENLLTLFAGEEWGVMDSNH